MERNHQNKRKSCVWLAVLIIMAAVLSACTVPDTPVDAGMQTNPAGTEAGSGEETVAAEATEEAVPSVEFPAAFADGRLEIVSLFQFDGINPDCGNQEGKKIAAIQLKNTSDEYLTEAKVAVTLADGTALNFLATHIPAGKSVMAFALDNQSIEDDAVCAEITCDAVFDRTSAVSDKVSVSVSGMTVTLDNNTDENISQIVVYCHSPLGEEYFGGITYQYTVNDLPAHGSTTVDALDCILGMAEVVRIAIN